MQNRPYRYHHLLELLGRYDTEKLPLDRLIHDYFRANKALGSKDRAFIAETCYCLMRQLLLIDFLLKDNISWERRVDLFLSNEWKSAAEDQTLPLHIRFSFPEPLFNRILASFGSDTETILRASNQAAPITIRANTLKISRDELLEKLKPFGAITGSCPTAIHFPKRISLFTLPEFQQGLFEVQDEASQQVAEMVAASPGDHVLDFCSGSGGKALAIAPRLNQKGQIYLHDIRPSILAEAKKRLKRAGIQNVQILNPESVQLKKLRKKCDWVLVDAPCSGTGTIRRNPDMKWRFSDSALKRLLGEQRTIFEKALSYLKPGGRIVFATCSILREENQDQVDHFIKTYNLKIEGNVLQTVPKEGGGDGFFAAVLSLNHSVA